MVGFEWIFQLEAEDDGIAFVRLGAEIALAAALGAAFDVFQSRAEAVENRHVAEPRRPRPLMNGDEG